MLRLRFVLVGFVSNNSTTFSGTSRCAADFALGDPLCVFGGFGVEHIISYQSDERRAAAMNAESNGSPQAGQPVAPTSTST